MTADSSIYDSERVAAAYAFTRPPVHRHLVARLPSYLSRPGPIAVALDIGCGAGMSTAALALVAKRTVGLEPHRPMLAHSGQVAPTAVFCVGRAEALPFSPGAFDLVTAAGALNYADLALSLGEVARVLSVRGLFAPYDFSAGRRIRDDTRLAAWHDEFQARFPSPPGYALDLRALDYRAHGLALAGYEAIEVGITMSLTQYIDYLLGEAGVEMALRRGGQEAQVRAYCEAGLAGIFDSGPREVLFDAQLAVARAI